MRNIGRPEYTEEQYKIWLDELSPIIKSGNTLYSAMHQSGLLKHRHSIYHKYRLNGWFRNRIVFYQRDPYAGIIKIMNIPAAQMLTDQLMNFQDQKIF